MGEEGCDSFVDAADSEESGERLSIDLTCQDLVNPSHVGRNEEDVSSSQKYCVSDDDMNRKLCGQSLW